MWCGTRLGLREPVQDQQQKRSDTPGGASFSTARPSQRSDRSRSSRGAERVMSTPGFSGSGRLRSSGLTPWLKATFSVLGSAVAMLAVGAFCALTYPILRGRHGSKALWVRVLSPAVRFSRWPLTWMFQTCGRRGWEARMGLKRRSWVSIPGFLSTHFSPLKAIKTLCSNYIK